MHTGSKLLLIAAIAAVLAPSQILAKEADFISCDGLKAPKRSGDGMRPPPDHLFGKRPYTITACDSALADPKLLPAHAPRRAHLLRARAIGHLAAGYADQALADIDAAQEAAKEYYSDPMFVRSMGVSFDLVRAAAWQRKGDFARARQLAQAAGDARPYSLSVQRLVTNFLYAADSPAEQALPYARLLPLEPDSVEEQFLWLAEQGQYDKALAVYPRLKIDFPQLKPDDPKAIFKMQPEGASTVLDSMVNAMLAAYAYAATGETEKARALLADTQAKVQAALAEQMATSPHSFVKRTNDLAALLSLMVDGRIGVAEGKAQDVVKSLVGKELPLSPVTAEFYTALKAALPDAQKDFAPDPTAVTAKLAEQAKESGSDIGMLVRNLPAPEFSRRSTDYKKSRKSVFDVFAPSGYKADGFRSNEDPATGVITVEFTGSSASAAAVDEMTLLHAADLARQKGKTGFIIVSRSFYSRTVNVMMNGRHHSSKPSGFQGELGIRLVDADNLPEDLKSERDRVLDANRVYEALAPVYIQPTETKSS